MEERIRKQIIKLQNKRPEDNSKLSRTVIKEIVNTYNVSENIALEIIYPKEGNNITNSEINLYEALEEQSSKLDRNKFTNLNSLIDIVNSNEYVSISTLMINMPCGYELANQYMKYLLIHRYIDKEEVKHRKHKVLSKEEREQARKIIVVHLP